MAPDSRLWRHQLGETAIGSQRVALKAALPIFLLLSLFTFKQAQARPEPKRSSLDEFSAHSLSNERQPHGDSLLTPLSPPSNFWPFPSPTGPMRERIQIPIPKKPLIQQYIRFYQDEERATFIDAMERSRPLVPLMAEILESNGVPAGMVAIVFVESRFRRHASFRGAGGYWQMLGSTARTMGLRVDRWADERRDPIKSTKAAAKYLRALYEQYDCWVLALAAYNAGARPVSGAVKRHCAKDYWEISGRRGLPARTREYVPKVLAAMEIMRDPEAYGFECPKYFARHDFDPVLVRSPLKLEEIAGWIDTSVGELRELNPSLRLDTLPPDTGFALRLPSGARDRFDLAYAEYLRK
jgi:membrane-bound lytic murein transglycosylase D